MGDDAGALDAAKRTRCRQQARDWLNQDLALWASLLMSESPAASTRARSVLSHWQRDPDLGVLREPSALDKLPVDERRQCVALWESVAELLKRAEKRN
jgi:hypothetical protein